jgi:hypothetical protein
MLFSYIQILLEDAMMYQQTSNKTLSIIYPTLPSFADIERVVRNSWESGIVTVGPPVRTVQLCARLRKK